MYRQLAPPSSDASGYWNQSIDEDNRCINEIAMRAVLPDAGFATTYCHVPLALTHGILEIRDPIVLYDIDRVASLPPLADADAPRDVMLADGLVLEVTPSVFFGDEYDHLAASRIPVADPPCFAEGLDLLGLYAFGPEVAVLGATGGFPIRIPNVHGLADGTRVDLFVLGGLDTFLPDGTQVHEAAFEAYGTASVSGGMIVSDVGSELPYLSWLGYRVR